MDRLFTLPLNYQEGTVGSQLTSCMALKDLMAVSGLPEDQALRAILALRLAGVFAPFEAPHEQTDSGRLRIRKAALESGIAVDQAAAAAVLGASFADEADVGGAPLSMDEFESTAPWSAPASDTPPAPPSDPRRAPAPPPAPSEPHPAQRRPESGQLRVLASVYVQMAEVEAAAGNFNGAVKYYETALGQKPNDLNVILPFANYLLSFDRAQTREAAERLLKRACASNPNAVEPRLALARLFRASGRQAQALDALAEAERVAPNNPDVRAMLDGKPRGGGGLFARLRGGG
jgi:hypothetical protein